VRTCKVTTLQLGPLNSPNAGKPTTVIQTGNTGLKMLVSKKDFDWFGQLLGYTVSIWFTNMMLTKGPQVGSARTRPEYKPVSLDP
jgi:hypothetical protein